MRRSWPGGREAPRRRHPPGRRVTLTVSAKGIKTIDRDGIEAVVARIRARGDKI
ncbi:hypothetical protein [Nocardia asiatica]|uniref:hypothetical protein n=1 Tax=Nocardia asiatica TaxID=209252 RepID=UPI003CC7D0E5